MVVGFAYVSLLVIFGWVTQRDSVTSAVAGVDARLQKRYSLWFDGGSRVLQGKAAAGGYVIRDELGCMQSTKATTKIRTLSGVDDGVVAFGSCYFGLDINHHAAEYMALIEGLYRVRRLVEQDRLAESSVGHSLFIEGDANMVIKPLQKRLSVASATEFELNKYHSMVQALQSSLRIGTVSLRHVKRNLNAEADKYANVALDSRQTLLYSRLHQRSPNLTDHEVAESSSNDAAEYVGPAGGVLLLRLQPSSHSRSQSLSAARVPVALEVNGLSITVRPFVRGTERGYKTREAKDEVALNSVAVDLDTEHYRQPGSALGSVGDGDADADPRPRSRVLVYQENLSPFISGAGAQAAISDSSFPLDDCSGLTGGYGGYDPHAAELEEAPSTSNDLRGIPILQRPLDTLQPSVQRVGRSREGAGESSIWHHLAIPYVSKRDVAAMNADLKAGVTPLTSSAASSEGMPTPDPSGMRSGPGHHRNASSCITVSIAYVSARSCLATEGTDDLPTLHRLAATSPDTLRRSLMRTANGVSGVTEAPVGAPLEAPIRASEQHDIEASPSPPSNPHVNPHDEAAHVHESYGDEFVIEEVMRGLARRGVLSQALALSVNVTAATGATASGEAPSVVALTPLQLSLLTGQ
jgi:ribonuclease HI